MLLEEKEEKLRASHYDHISLNTWFENHQFDAIDALLDDLDEHPNLPTLGLICMLAQRLYLKPNAEDFTVEELKQRIIPLSSTYSLWTNLEPIYRANMIIKGKCESILCRVISIWHKYRETIPDEQRKYIYANAIESLCSHPSAKVRLHYCANIHYEPFVNDADERLRKVAKTQIDFYQKYIWCDRSDRNADLEFIAFLTRIIETGAFAIVDGDIRYDQEDRMFIFVDSLLLLDEGFSEREFDYDLVYTFDDKRYLAAKFLEYLKMGKIKFQPGILPLPFERILNNSDGEISPRSI